MSVVIKSMEMPKNCGECRFKGLKPYLDDDGDRHIGDACMIFGELVDAKICSSVCPLIELPPHGDLIDRDEAYNHFLELMKIQGGINPCQLGTILVDAPTIIEAEGEDANT